MYTSRGRKAASFRYAQGVAHDPTSTRKQGRLASEIQPHRLLFLRLYEQSRGDRHTNDPTPRQGGRFKSDPSTKPPLLKTTINDPFRRCYKDRAQKMCDPYSGWTRLTQSGRNFHPPPGKKSASGKTRVRRLPKSNTCSVSRAYHTLENPSVKYSAHTHTRIIKIGISSPTHVYKAVAQEGKR